jgi:hypothetical protein
MARDLGALPAGPADQSWGAVPQLRVNVMPRVGVFAHPAKLAARLGDRVRIEPADPDRFYVGVSDPDALLPGPNATLVGPSFEQWLSSRDFEEWPASQRGQGHS